MYSSVRIFFVILKIQLIAQFLIFPSSESRHSFVANYTSEVTIRGSLMKPKWQKLDKLAQEMCTLWFQFFGAAFASKGYPFKNIFKKHILVLFCCIIIALYVCESKCL